VKKRCVIFFCFLISFIALTGCGHHASELNTDAVNVDNEVPSLPAIGNVDDQNACEMIWMIDDSVFSQNDTIVIWDICKTNYYDLWSQISREIFKDSTIIGENRTSECRELSLDNGIAVDIFEDYLALELVDEQVFSRKYERTFVEMVLTSLPVCTGFDLLENDDSEHNLIIDGIPLDKSGYAVQDMYIPGAQIICKKNYLGNQIVLILMPYMLPKQVRNISSRDLIPVATIKNLCEASFSDIFPKPLRISFDAAEFVYFMKSDTQQLSVAWRISGNILHEDEYSVDMSFLIDAITGEVYR